MAARGRPPTPASRQGPGGHAPSPAHDGPLVAVLLDPPLPVQAVWRVDPVTRADPLAVREPGGPVLAVCPRAAARGVAVGHGAAQARLLCPDLRVISPDREAASLLWETLLDALATVSPLVEAADGTGGLAYLDAHGLDPLWGDGAAVARQAVRALAARGPGRRGPWRWRWLGA